MFERLRDRVGSPTRKRYHSGEYHLPEEVSDPHGRRDETKTDRLKYVKEHPGWSALLFIIVAGVIILFAQQLMRFGVSIYENRWARLFGGAFVIAGFAYVSGRRTQHEAYEGIDRLVLKLPNGVRRYHGHYVENDEGDAPLFVPIRGWSWLGRPGEKMQVRDISYEIAQTYANANRDPEDAAVIRLQPGFAAIGQTDHGTVIAQLSDGLSIDPFGRQSNLVASLPDQAEESALESLQRELESAREELKHERQKITKLKRQRDHFKEEAEKAREEHVEPIIKYYQQIRAVEPRTAGPNDLEGQASIGGPVDVAEPGSGSGDDYDPDAIEEDLSDDDDE